MLHGADSQAGTRPEELLSVVQLVETGCELQRSVVTLQLAKSQADALLNQKQLEDSLRTSVFHDRPRRLTRQRFFTHRSQLIMNPQNRRLSGKLMNIGSFELNGLAQPTQQFRRDCMIIDR